MILNSYAILDVFVTLLRLALALIVTGLGISVLRAWRRGASAEGRLDLENRGYLLFSLALLLLLLNLASWPLLYLLLESYVPEWPGVMCIYGVTRVGLGSQGPSRFMPGLLQALQVLKPALIFGSGAWLTLYLANRRTATSPLMGRVLAALIALGVLAGVDAALEAAYLAVPKKEEFLSSGCCLSPQDGGGRFLPSGILGENAPAWLPAAYYTANAAMILSLFASVRLRAPRPTRVRLAFLLAGAVAALAVSGLYLTDVAAPALLRLPHHHCPYDLIPRVPESVLAAASFAAGTFAVGWACVAAWFANCPETRPFLGEQVRTILTVGLFGYLGSLMMLSLELALV